jgi:hypothetical protein
VCFHEVPLGIVCFVGVKEQLINDLEGLVMMYDEREDKSKKNQEHFQFSIIGLSAFFSEFIYV